MRCFRLRLGSAVALTAALAVGLPARPLDEPLRSTLSAQGQFRGNVRWAYLVEALDTGRVLASRNADLSLKPASNLKLLTAAAALDLLGPDHRIPTTVYAEGRRDGSTLRGDLWVRGLADPTYNGVHSDSASGALRNLADAIHDTGLRRVTGDLVITGLLVYADGRGATQALGRGADTLALSNDRRDRGKRMPTDVGTARIVGQSDFFREANRAAGRRLKSLLVDIGVRIEGSVRTATTLQPPGTQIARRTSPPLRSIVRRVLRSSLNLHSDLLLLHLGSTQQGRLRLSSGIATARHWLQSTGASTDGLHMVDGSGLSHANRMTATQLLATLRRMDRSPAAEAWRQALPLAGRSGTLAHRLRGTAAEANLRAKTGTLTGAAALSGYVADRANGERLAFAIIENSPYDRPVAKDQARRVVDRIAAQIAEGVPERRLPVRESFRDQDPTLAWRTPSGVSLRGGISLGSPEGDGHVGRLTRRGPGQSMAVTGPLETSHVAVEAQVHLSYNPRVDQSALVPYQGIVVRAEGEDWVRYVADFDRDRTLKIQAHVDGQWQRLITWTYPQDFPDPGGPGWHTMRLELRGREVRAFFDGNRMPGRPVQVSSRPKGRSGIYAWHWGDDGTARRSAHFDRFRITDLAPSASAQ
jgi:D-alanyl-D-alanine carboxypeptidase/D-alanyl-D-alanine-endopeptidase (penicillin-binding protein 4)